jgi:hypothetical protein
MKPIILSEFNEALTEYPNTNIDDRNKLSFCAGIHLHCGGIINLKTVSNTHEALVCKECGLRIVVPSGLKTYGDLRRHMKVILSK